MASVCHHPHGVSQVEVVCLVLPGALNDIRFAAYRTGMKLRMLQKKLGCELYFFSSCMAVECITHWSIH